MEIKKGIIKGFDGSTYKAVVQIVGSLSVWLGEVIVTRIILSSKITGDRNCSIIFFAPANPSDAVIIAVYT